MHVPVVKEKVFDSVGYVKSRSGTSTDRAFQKLSGGVGVSSFDAFHELGVG